MARILKKVTKQQSSSETAPKASKPAKGKDQHPATKDISFAVEDKKPTRFTHDAKSEWTGPSAGFNERRSKTRVPVEEYNTRPDYVLSERTQAILSPLRKKYGSTPFQRGNLDAGVIKYAIRKGHLQPVGGDPTNETLMLKFTANGLANK